MFQHGVALTHMGCAGAHLNLHVGAGTAAEFEGAGALHHVPVAPAHDDAPVNAHPTPGLTCMCRACASVDVPLPGRPAKLLLRAAAVAEADHALAAIPGRSHQATDD